MMPSHGRSSDRGRPTRCVPRAGRQRACRVSRARARHRAPRMRRCAARIFRPARSRRNV